MAPDLTTTTRPPDGHSGFWFGEASQRNLDPRRVHPDMITLTCEALLVTTVDFGVHDSDRTPAEQAECVKRKVSMTMDSRHVAKPRDLGGNGLAHAVDVHPALKVNGKTRWDGALFAQIYRAFELASRRTGIPFAWGGNWRRFVDMPHFELPRDVYPPECAVTDAQRGRAAAALAKVTRQNSGQPE